MNYKKETTQRQKEKAAAAAVAATKRPPVKGEVERAKNESEAKIFTVLDGMGIAHVDL